MNQTSLFDHVELDTAIAFPPCEKASVQHYDLDGGEVSLFANWLTREQAEEHMSVLTKALHWEQTVLNFKGRQCPIPRLNAWYGDPGAWYRYSGVDFMPNPWHPLLDELRHRLCAQLAQSFNSVLANWYRDGQDSVSWHADNEPELGVNPVIASVSFGATRRFMLKHRQNQSLPKLVLELPAGSLLVMRGATQHHWLHQVPKTRKPVAQRLNLTYRTIVKQ